MPIIKGNFDIERNIEVYQNRRQKYIDEGYLEYSCVRKGLVHDLLSAAAGLPAFAAIPVYIYFTGEIPAFETKYFLLCLFLLFITTPIHELLHAVGWTVSSKTDRKNIFIYLPSGLSDAYCHCGSPLRFFEYTIGSLLPLIIMSVIPSAISVLIHSTLLLYLSVFNAFGCGSDIINSVIAFIHRDEIILDYPTDCGFTSYKKV